MYARSAASGSDAGDVPLHRLAKGSDSSAGSASRVSANLQSLQRPDGQQLSITDFEVLSKIGEGGFGTVLLVRKRSTGKLYALKVLVKKSMRRTGDARRAISESAAMQEIKHPFVVTLHFAFQDEKHVYFVLEFVGGGDLYSHLERQTFSEDVRARAGRSARARAALPVSRLPAPRAPLRARSGRAYTSRRSRWRSRTCTRTTSFTATSSRRTFSWRTTGTSSLPTLVSPRSSTRASSKRAAARAGRVRAWAAGGSTR